MSPCRLYLLEGVPEDETAEICALLDSEGVAYYVVPASFLGVSPASIWLHDAADEARAKALLDDYQAARGERARREYEALKREGRHLTLAGGIRAHPMRFMAALAFAALVLYLSLGPFLNFGK